MNNHTLVFGGWSLSPSLLEGCFGQDCTYIDSNIVMPELFDNNNKILSTWPEILQHHLHLSNTHRYHLAGWSTGAIIALALASILQAHSLTLIAPTVSFCRRDGFRHGVHPSVLRSMREQLQLNTRNVLEKFYRSCGFDETFNPEPIHTVKQLTLGLHFLEQIDLTKTVNTCSNTNIIHGRNDAIIPYAAAEVVAATCSGSIHCFDAGHAVFYGRESEIAHYINNHTFEGNLS